MLVQWYSDETCTFPSIRFFKYKHWFQWRCKDFESKATKEAQDKNLGGLSYWQRDVQIYVIFRKWPLKTAKGTARPVTRGHRLLSPLTHPPSDGFPSVSNSKTSDNNVFWRSSVRIEPHLNLSHFTHQQKLRMCYQPTTHCTSIEWKIVDLVKC